MNPYNWVTERIAVGGGLSYKEDVDALMADGVTHIINTQAEFDDETLVQNRVLVLWLPEQDDGTIRPAGHYRKALQFSYEALAAPKNKIYVHCGAGANRGPTMCYALLRAFGIAKEEAINLIKVARPQVTFFTIQNYIDSVEQQLLEP